MSMKKTAALMGMTAAMMSMGVESPIIKKGISYNPPKRKLSKKQQKGRNKSKAARKARRKNR